MLSSEKLISETVFRFPLFREIQCFRISVIVYVKSDDFVGCNNLVIFFNEPEQTPLQLLVPISS